LDDRDAVADVGDEEDAEGEDLYGEELLEYVSAIMQPILQATDPQPPTETMLQMSSSTDFPILVSMTTLMPKSSLLLPVEPLKQR